MLKLILRYKRILAVLTLDGLCLFGIVHLNQETSWDWRFVRFFLGILATCVTTIWSLGPSQLRWLGTKPFLSPNWMTIWRIPIIAIGFFVFIKAQICHETFKFTSSWTSTEFWQWLGLLLAVHGIALDRLDGKMATSLIAGLQEHQKSHWLVAWAWFFDPVYTANHTVADLPPGMAGFRRVMVGDWTNKLSSPYTRLPMFHLVKVEPDPNNSKQVEESKQPDYNYYHLRLTGIGEWLDPLVDKINFLPLFAYLSYLGYCHWAPVTLMITTDLIGTVFRPPFETLWPFQKLQRFVRQVKASPLGKLKFFLQSMTFVVVMPALAGWMSIGQKNTSNLIASFLLALAGILGAFNVFSRLTMMVWVLEKTGLGKRYQQFKELFDHNGHDDDDDHHDEDKDVPGVSSNGE